MYFFSFKSPFEVIEKNREVKFFYEKYLKRIYTLRGVFFRISMTLDKIAHKSTRQGEWGEVPHAHVPVLRENFTKKTAKTDAGS